MPTLLGNLLGHNSFWTRTWQAVGESTAGPATMPSSASPGASHREGSPPGGSATTITPPLRRNGEPHSAVTAGPAKPRATTRSKAPLRSSERAAVSALSATTDTRSARPNSPTTSRRNDERLRLPSSRIHRDDGHRRARGNPGTPPPLPRSRARDGRKPPARPRSRALVTCSSTGPGPRKPSSFAFASTPRS